jgi:hypothetical protein
MTKAVRRICGARTRAGHPCGQWASRHLERCWLHGSKTPNSVRKAAREEVLSVVTKGELIPADIQPVTVLRGLLTEAVAMKDYFSQRMAVLESLRYSSDQGFEQQRSEWTFWSNAFDKAVKLAAILSGMKLEELEQRIELAQAQIVGNAVTAALKDFAWITPDREQALRHAIGDRLRSRIAARDRDKLEVD